MSEPLRPAGAPVPLDLFLSAKKKPVALPDFGGERLADTHTHLACLDDPARALARAALAGLGLLCTVTSIHEDAARTYAELDTWCADARRLLDAGGFTAVALPTVRIIVGSHPHDAARYDAAAAAQLEERADDERCVGLGELGLDYFYDLSPRPVQRAVFAEQMRLAIALNKVVCLHIRDAHADALAVLERTGLPAAGCILHCFNLGTATMKAFQDLGCMVSFAGPLTFKKGDEVREAAAAVLPDRLLTETDAPYMAPEPCRGPGNEPAYMVFTAALLARVRGMEPADLARLTYGNATRLFGVEAR